MQHNAQVQQQLLKQHQELTGVLASLYKYFEANSEEVQVEWVRFTRKVRLDGLWQRMNSSIHQNSLDDAHFKRCMPVHLQQSFGCYLHCHEHMDDLHGELELCHLCRTHQANAKLQ